MSRADIIFLLPHLMLTLGAVLVMMAIAVRRNHFAVYVLTCLTLIVALYFLPKTASLPHNVGVLFVVDGLGVFNTMIIMLAALAVALMSYAYFDTREERTGEYYMLFILATFGACIMVISGHFVSFFLGLEILSVSLYGMIAYLRKRERSDEAGIKYLILAAFSSAFLLFGMALIYAATGDMTFEGLSGYFSAFDELPILVMTGVGLVVVGAGFKLSVVPFHMWTPDVYEGAPAPVAAFISTISKGATMVLLVRFFLAIDGFRFPVVLTIFTVISIASMVVGNILALRQQNVKRILAYSSIAHFGYLLVAFIAADELGVEAVNFYLVAYFATMLGAFGVVTVLSHPERDAELLDDYRGLLWSRPALATVFVVTLLSLAGIPLTAGFVAKFYLLASGISTNQWLLVILLVVNSIVGLFYYIRIVAVMFDSAEEREARPAGYVGNFATLLILVVLLVWFGVSPQGLIDVIRNLVGVG
ncbi:MAG: NADH-quinone oxidoreductase subunit N [Bacteroidota bacterium]|jgi:NADH-quinone oxidoreductase subunit N|nr:MAG: NADH-quinone oxidoreductase subunit N [Bacteroidota bacterium]